MLIHKQYMISLVVNIQTKQMAGETEKWLVITSDRPLFAALLLKAKQKDIVAVNK